MIVFVKIFRICFLNLHVDDCCWGVLYRKPKKFSIQEEEVWLDTKSCWYSLKWVNNEWLNLWKGDTFFQDQTFTNNDSPSFSHFVQEINEIWYPGRAVSFSDTKFHWLPVQNGRITSDCWSKLVCRKVSPFQTLYHKFIIILKTVDFCENDWLQETYHVLLLGVKHIS